jgi:hypothetical protein
MAKNRACTWSCEFRDVRFMFKKKWCWDMFLLVVSPVSIIPPESGTVFILVLFLSEDKWTKPGNLETKNFLCRIWENIGLKCTFRLPQRCIWTLRSSGSLRNACWYLFTNFSRSLLFYALKFMDTNTGKHTLSTYVNIHVALYTFRFKLQNSTFKEKSFDQLSDCRLFITVSAPIAVN